MGDYAELVQAAAEMIAEASTIVAFSGAGISTESGLADFRSPGGLWDRYRVVTYPEFLSSDSARLEYWSMRRELIPTLLAADPNPAHTALAELEQRGKLIAVVTQNIDGLHQDAGSSRVLELHGTNRSASCLSCGKQWQIEEIQLRLDGDDLDPHCDRCDGLIKPDTISFGQSMPADIMDEAYQLAESADLMLMIGSSLAVQPAASVPLVAYQTGAKLIFINQTETEYDELAELVVHSGAGDFLTQVVERLEE
jgi:NAD-dependent deacetylase